jgi:hypothetical protein
LAGPEHSGNKFYEANHVDATFAGDAQWATHVGAENCKLDNSPFYAYGVSWEDVVSAPFSSDEGHPTFERVASKSGDRTVRVIFETPFEAGNATSVLAVWIRDSRAGM